MLLLCLLGFSARFWMWQSGCGVWVFCFSIQLGQFLVEWYITVLPMRMQKLDGSLMAVTRWSFIHVSSNPNGSHGTWIENDDINPLTICVCSYTQNGWWFCEMLCLRLTPNAKQSWACHNYLLYTKISSRDDAHELHDDIFFSQDGGLCNENMSFTIFQIKLIFTCIGINPFRSNMATS